MAPLLADPAAPAAVTWLTWWRPHATAVAPGRLSSAGPTRDRARGNGAAPRSTRRTQRRCGRSRTGPDVDAHGRAVPGRVTCRPSRPVRSTCHYCGVAHPSASASALLRHVRTGRARSRAELVALTGASRNTVSARVDQLIAANLLEEGGRGWSTGGRPPPPLRFNNPGGCGLALGPGGARGGVPGAHPSPPTPR